MNNTIAVVLSLGLSLTIFLYGSVESAQFTFHNNCQFPVWPGTLTGAGQPQLSSTGFALQTGESQTLDVPAGWSGRFWGRTGCANDAAGKLVCQTADCASGQVACAGAGAVPPATLVELTLNGGGGLDFYDVSLVDGFNLPVNVAPQGGSGDCQTTSCPRNVNSVCPAELRVTGGDGMVVACKSACLVFNAPEYCCTGAYASPGSCPPTVYSRIFKDQCPQAYSYAYDDKSSTFTCGGSPNYLITFCP